MSSLREYELTCITRGDLSDSEQEKLIGKYEKILTGDGGQVLSKSDWGVKKLSYPIKKQFRGRYYLYDFLGSPENLAEAQRLMRIDEGVLRFLSIKLGESVDPDTRKVEIAKQQAAVRAASQSSSREDHR